MTDVALAPEAQQVFRQAQDQLQQAQPVGDQQIDQAQAAQVNAHNLQVLLSDLLPKLLNVDQDPTPALAQADAWAKQHNVVVPQETIDFIRLLSSQIARNFAAQVSQREKSLGVQRLKAQALQHLREKTAIAERMQNAARNRLKTMAQGVRDRIQQNSQDLGLETPFLDLFSRSKNAQDITKKAISKVITMATPDQLTLASLVFNQKDPEIARELFKMNRNVLPDDEYDTLSDNVLHQIKPFIRLHARLGANAAPHYNKQIKNPQVNAKILAEARKAHNALPLTSTNSLIAYPQWIASDAKKHKQISKQAGQWSRFGQRMKDPDDKVFGDLHDLNPILAYWNPSRNTWQGTYVRKKAVKLNNQGAAVAKRVARVNKILKQTQLTPEQQLTQIPDVCLDIVASNKSLSNSGFGAVSSKEGASRLYAGRWVDNTTGTIRLIPKPSTKYLNPLSLKQKIAFVEARILNNWNEIVDDTTLRTKLKAQDPKGYAQAQIKRIEQGFSHLLGLWQYNQKISNILLAHFEDNQLDIRQLTPANLILNQAKNSTLQRIYNMPYPRSIAHGGSISPHEVQEKDFNTAQNTIMKKRAQQFIGVIDKSAKQIIDMINTGYDVYANYTAKEKMQQANKIISAAESLTNSTQAFTTAMNKVIRASLIPENLTGKDMVLMTQRVDQNVQAVKKMGEQFGRFVAPTKELKASLQSIIKPFIEKLELPSTMLDSAKNQHIGQQLQRQIQQLPADQNLKFNKHSVARTLPTYMKQNKRNYGKQMFEAQKFRRQQRKSQASGPFLDKRLTREEQFEINPNLRDFMAEVQQQQQAGNHDFGYGQRMLEE